MYINKPLLIGEIEVENKKELNEIKNIGKDITKNKKYKNKNLAEKNSLNLK
ncbi:MAG: hypothetical protein ACOCP8_04125 [archaeon]